MGGPPQRSRSARATTTRTRARSRQTTTTGISESSRVTATIDGELPPAGVRRQLHPCAWHLGFAPECHDLTGHLGAAMLHPGLLAPPGHRAPAFSRPLSLGGPWRNFLSGRARTTTATSPTNKVTSFPFFCMGSYALRSRFLHRLRTSRSHIPGAIRYHLNVQDKRSGLHCYSSIHSFI